MVDLSKLKHSQSKSNSSLSSFSKLITHPKYSYFLSQDKPFQVIRGFSLPKLPQRKSLFCNANSSYKSQVSQKQKHSTEVITKFIPPNSPDSNSIPDKTIFDISIDKIKKLQYNKPFSKFGGFVAFTYKNKEICNSDKLDICINKEVEEENKKGINDESLLVHFFAIHHGMNGGDVPALLKKRLKYYLFKNKNCIYNTVQGIRDAYHKMEFEVYQKIPKSYEYGNSSISAFVIENQIYIANIGNSKCLISCNDKIPFYIVTHPNNLSAAQIPQIINKDLQLELSLKQCVTLDPPTNKTPLLKQSSTFDNPLNSLSKKYIRFAVPEITQMNISDNIYFFIFINDSISKAISSKALMLIIYRTMYHSLDKDYSYEQMCSTVINQICIEVIKAKCTSSLTVLFLPLQNFISLYDISNKTKIANIISQIENEIENNEQIYNRCIIHEPNVNGLLKTSTDNSCFLDNKYKDNISGFGSNYFEYLGTSETYNTTSNKGKIVSKNNTLLSQQSQQSFLVKESLSNIEMHKKGTNKHKKRKILCGCFA